MIIGFDGSRAFESESTGTENYSWQILKNLISIDTENKYYVYVREGYNKRDFDFPPSVKIMPIKLPRLWTQLGLATRTFNDPLDVLFVPAHTLPLIRKPDLPTVMVVHDLGAEYLPAMHQIKQQLYLNFITHHQLKTATHLIAVSEATKKDLIAKIKIPASKISVVYEAYEEKKKNEAKIDKTLCKFGLEDKPYFLFVGTIQPRKNLIRLIEAFSLFLIESQDKARDCQLVIAGKPGWDYDEILSLPEKLGIKQRIKFVGRVDDSELADLYKGAVALTYPSLFEGFGLPILEAYDNGCPVITSTTSSMPEVAGKGAILVDPTSVNAIMTAMNSLFHDKEQRRSLIKLGQEQLTHFSWKKAAQETLEVLKKAAKERK